MGFLHQARKGITFENVKLVCDKKDYRTAVVLDDVHGAHLQGSEGNGTGKQKGEHLFMQVD